MRLRRTTSALCISVGILIALTGAACGGEGEVDGSASPSPLPPGDTWAASCGEELMGVTDEQIGQPVPMNVTVVLSDVSKSTASRRDEFRKGLCATASELISEGGTLWGGRITSRGVQGFALLGSFDFAKPDGGCANNLMCSTAIDKRRMDAADRVAGWIEDVVEQIDPAAGTDVQSAIQEAARTLHDTPDAPCRRVVILSDMAERAAGDTVSDVDPSAVPDLTGIRVQVIGAGATTEVISPEKAEALKAFWNEYFALSGASYSPNDYGPTFLGLAAC